MAPFAFSAQLSDNRQVPFPAITMKRKGADVKHIDLDQQDEQIKQFLLSLDVDPDGSILETEGHPVLRLLRISGDEEVDNEKLKAAILNRRDESLDLNENWTDADRNVLQHIPSGDE